MDAPTISVRGEAVREVPPELARFSVEVAASDAGRQAAVSRLAERAEGLRAVLDEYATAIERRETGGLHVWPETKRRGERVTAYRGSVTTTVTVTDFAVLGELMLRLADRDQTSVYGPWWALRPDSAAHRDARRAAVTEAVRRAKEYAEAVGAQVVRLLEISDVGTEPVPMAMTYAAAAVGARDGGAPPQLDLDPQAQTVHAQVAMRFTITEPTGLG